MSSPMEHRLTVKDIPMRWLESSIAPESELRFQVILLHGIPTDPLLFRHVFPLIRGARCFAWELIGYGDSIPAGKGRDISVRKQADYLMDWMDAVGIEKAILVGHDLGGGVAQIAAVRRPDRFVGLVLLNSIGYDSWPVPAIKIIRAAGMRTLFSSLVPTPMFKMIFRNFISSGHDVPEVVEESFRAHWAYYSKYGGAPAFLAQARSLSAKDTLEVSRHLRLLPEKGIKCKVVWGASDTYQKLHYGQRFAIDLRTDLIRIESGKHFIPEDHPDVVSTVINDLIRSLKEIDEQQQQQQQQQQRSQPIEAQISSAARTGPTAETETETETDTKQQHDETSRSKPSSTTTATSGNPSRGGGGSGDSGDSGGAAAGGGPNHHRLRRRPVSLHLPIEEIKHSSPQLILDSTTSPLQTDTSIIKVLESLDSESQYSTTATATTMTTTTTTTTNPAVFCDADVQTPPLGALYTKEHEPGVPNEVNKPMPEGLKPAQV